MGRYLTLGWSVPVRLPGEWVEWREDVARFRRADPRRRPVQTRQVEPGLGIAVPLHGEATTFQDLADPLAYGELVALVVIETAEGEHEALTLHHALQVLAVVETVALHACPAAAPVQGLGHFGEAIGHRVARVLAAR